jgi:hypothetical protein
LNYYEATYLKNLSTRNSSTIKHFQLSFGLIDV